MATSINIDGDLRARLERAKKRTGASLGSMARVAIDAWLRQQEVSA